MSSGAGKALLNSLSRAAARILKNTRGAHPVWKDKCELCIEAYGYNPVYEDFVKWAESVKTNPPENPISVYLKTVDARLGNGPVENPDADAILAAAFECTRNAPPLRSLVLELLDQYKRDEIIEALREFTTPLDDYDLKNATKNFFQEGGVHAIILARRNRVESQRKLKEAEERSVAAGLKKNEEERKARELERLEEQATLERMRKSDSPF